jgi:hypothetical protein
VVRSVRKVWKLSAIPGDAVEDDELLELELELEGVLVAETTVVGMVASTDMALSVKP